MRTSLVIDALQMGIDAGLGAPDAIFHSDRGHYTSAEFHRFCKGEPRRTNVVRNGVCWDNAAAAFFAALKNEMYYRHNFATERSPLRRGRVHRRLLQPPTAALHARLLHPFEALTNHRTASAA